MQKPTHKSTYSRVEWSAIAGFTLLLWDLIAYCLAEYDRLIGIHY